MPSRFHEYEIVARRLPSEQEPSPKLYKMFIFGPNKVVAQSRFWHLMRKLKKLKKSTGELVSIKEVSEKKSVSVKNFGVWIRYDSRSGTHNMYKEYRELSRVDCVDACFNEMASRHKARFDSIYIIKVEELKDTEVRRTYIKQLLAPDLKFPHPQRYNTHGLPKYMEALPSPVTREPHG